MDIMNLAKSTLILNVILCVIMIVFGTLSAWSHSRLESGFWNDRDFPRELPYPDRALLQYTTGKPYVVPGRTYSEHDFSSALHILAVSSILLYLCAIIVLARTTYIAFCRAPNRCRNCGYDTRASTKSCPECGNILAGSRRNCNPPKN